MKNFYSKYPLVNIDYSKIQVGAYFKWLKRSKKKTKGDPAQDWIEAENEHFKEALKYLKNLHQSTISHPSLDTEQFHDIYNILGSASYSALDSEKKIFGSTEDGCYLCKKSRGETKFKTIAHLIPEAFGNKTIISLNECDNCNSMFGRSLENELANMFQIERAAFGTAGKKSNTVKFKKGSSGQKKSSIGGGPRGGSIQMTNVDEDDSIKFKIDHNHLGFSSRTQSFYPVKALRSIAKSTLLLDLDKSKREELDHIRKWVTGAIQSSGYIRWAHVFMPGPPIPQSGLLLLEQTRYQDLPTFLAVFFFHNIILVLSLPEKDNMTHHKPIIPPAFVFNEKLMPTIEQLGIPHDVKAVTDVSMRLMANKVHEIHFDRSVPVLLQTRKISIRAVLETTWFEDAEIVWHKYKLESDGCFEFDIIIDRSINQFTAEIIFPLNENNIPLMNQLVSCFHNKGETFLISEVTEQGTLRKIIDFSTVQSVSGLGKRVLVK